MEHVSPLPPSRPCYGSRAKFKGRIDLTDCSDVSEGPMTHTLSTPRRFLFPPTFLSALRLNHGGIGTESSKKKLIATFSFPPPRCLGIDRPKSNIHTPEENLSIYLAKTRDGMYAPWHEQRHRRHCDQEKSSPEESNDFSRMREKERERENRESRKWMKRGNRRWRHHHEGGAWFSSHAWNWKTRDEARVSLPRHDSRPLLSEGERRNILST